VTIASRPWRDRAVALYDAPYARRYREHDDHFLESQPCCRFAERLQDAAASLERPIDVLDLGCGTGRYFWALAGVRELVGVDASAAMLAEARRPFNGHRITAERVTLVEGDLVAHDFGAERFDFVYSIGVLAEHVPLDAVVVNRVHRSLKRGGVFAFSTVHPDSPSIPRTLKRRVGRAIAVAAPESIGRPFRDRLLAGGLYADERRVVDLLSTRLSIETLYRFTSEAHLHCWCVARKSAS